MTCQHCNKELPPAAPTGRPRLYCDVTCRHAAYATDSVRVLVKRANAQPPTFRLAAYEALVMADLASRGHTVYMALIRPAGVGLVLDDGGRLRRLEVTTRPPASDVEHVVAVVAAEGRIDYFGFDVLKD
jgi:hypothetical protein